MATRIVREVSFTGVGVGSFHTLATDYARKYGVGNRLPFDNALNWYLHQFAELGLFGSVGWIAWIIVFIRTLLVPPVPAVVMTPTGLLRCVLVAFGIASLLGYMPRIRKCSSLSGLIPSGSLPLCPVLLQRTFQERRVFGGTYG